MADDKTPKQIAFTQEMWADAEAKAAKQEPVILKSDEPVKPPVGGSNINEPVQVKDEPKDQGEKKLKTEKKSDEPKSEKTTGKSTKIKEKEQEPADETLETEQQIDQEDLLEMITGKVKEKYLTPEEQRQLLQDLENHSKFMASNTQKAQQIAQEAKELELLRNRIGHEKAQKAIDAFLNNPKLVDFLDVSGEWFEDGNPVKELVEALKLTVPEVQKVSKEQEKILEEKKNIELEKEILAVQRIDPAYTDEDKLDELADVAIKRNVNLVTALELVKSNSRAEELTKLQEKNKELSKELKERVKEIADLKAKGYYPSTEANVVKKGVTSESYEKPASSWDEAMNRVKKDVFNNLVQTG